MRSTLTCLALALFANAPLYASQPLPLVQSGTASSIILISDQPEEGDGIRFQKASTAAAARELGEVLRQISGATIPTEQISPSTLSSRLKAAEKNNQTPILLGSLAREYLSQREKQLVLPKNPNGFVLKVDKVVAIAGASPRGTEIGTYELLEQLGVRWFFPGPLGTVIPTAREIKIPAQTTVQSPSFAARHFGFNALDKDPVIAEWKKHQREGGPFFPPAHGIKLGADVSFETHPEFYSLVKGQRVNRQICISNPEVLRRAIQTTRDYFRQNPEAPWIGMGPNDNGGFCECASCQAHDGGDWDPFSSDRSVTDRYIWFFNQILDAIKDEYPDKKIAFYIYHTYLRPPVKVKPNPRIVGALAPIGLCRVHGVSNPLCPEKGYLKRLLTEWKQILPEVYERAYWFNLADPGMWFVQTHRLKDELAFYAKEGITGFRTEVTPQWAVQGPSLYIAGKLMWNAKQDTDALLNEFCEKLFGPAAEPMKRYFRKIDERLEQSDHHTGSAFDITQFYPPAVRAELMGLIRKAKELATESPYRERVEVYALGANYSNNLAEMIEARNRHDWGKAHAALQAMDATREAAQALQPPVLSRQAESYLRRFFRLPVEQGHQRTTQGNVLVAPLEDRWEVLLDPQRVGESLNYFSPSTKGGNWQPTATFSTTWSNLGLRYYKGLAWFRQTIHIPKEHVGKRLFLWLGGVDETARVWVNGTLIGTSPVSAFTPFELDATEVLREGPNEVVLCVANLKVDELGTGGITAPGFVYAPAKGKDAVLENVKPLRETFP